jgi:hypothetical protein
LTFLLDSGLKSAAIAFSEALNAAFVSGMCLLCLLNQKKQTWIKYQIFFWIAGQ